MKKISTVLICIFCIYLIKVSQSYANGVLRDTIGPISTGRGGANIAYSDNGVLILDNPSALSEMEGKRFEGGFDLLTLSMNYRDKDNDWNGKEPLLFLPAFSYTQKISQHSVGIGLGFYMPAGFFTKYRLVHPDYREQEYTSKASLMKILFGLGCKMSDQLSFGAGVGPAYSGIEFKEPYTFQSGPLQGVAALIDMQGNDWALAWNLGAQWRISSETTLGLAYVNQTQFNMRGDLDLDVTEGGLQVTDPRAHYKVQYDFQWPSVMSCVNCRIAYFKSAIAL